MRLVKAKQIGFSIIGIDNEEAKKIITQIARKYKDKFYHGHWMDVQVAKDGDD